MAGVGAGSAGGFTAPAPWSDWGADDWGLAFHHSVVEESFAWFCAAAFSTLPSDVLLMMASVKAQTKNMPPKT